MEITLDLIKELRNKTGVGMTDCKKALQEADGDINKAVEVLRKKGAMLATKRADKMTNEGAIKSKLSDDKTSGSIVEVNCETDFVAKGEDFQKFAEAVAAAALEVKSGDIDTIMNSKMTDGLTVKESLDSLMGKVGEKIEIKRAEYISLGGDGFVAEYNHFGSKLGSMIGLKGKFTSEAEEIGKKIAMQVVAMNPISINREGVTSETIDKEREIYLSQSKNDNKPQNIIDKIVQNKIEKFYQDNCLLEQEFIQDSSMNVGDLLKKHGKEKGEPLEVVEMVRFQLG